ncbi:glycogen debranching protein [Cesiribacter sp. SM1]|uniref:alpha-L-rhamnosidase-related protein n=1 Tax=Cesiribacter sp. SM1 TaxID=2861196 RepID=UPI001CD1EB3D|nr:glycogen debranching protein [Cesiribacter sp. SM1]
MKNVFDNLKISILVSSCLGVLACCQPPQESDRTQGQPLWSSTEYAIYPDRVVQEGFDAQAISGTEMTSSYQSQANKYVSPRIDFKFSINGKDNEMPSGQDHHFSCFAGESGCQTPLIKFGQQFKDTTQVPAGTYLEQNTPLTIRLDMRHVFDAFSKQGFYRTHSGEKIYEEDFKGVYVAGGTAPMVWDFDNLANFPQLEMKDPDGDRIYELTLPMNAPDQKKSTAVHWKLSSDISSLPRYSSPYPLVNALYNMSLEEMLLDIEADSTFRTGKEWAGVWTRDISYSIILGMANLQPRVSQNSLMRKVKGGRIIQDTGTGGAYPVSTDRIVWALAAWEIYKATGDEDWLAQSYQIIKNSLEDDFRNAYNPETGLVKGESSFLDWREQTYPDWMQPVDIYESETLGTNAVHYGANKVLAQMAAAMRVDITAAKHEAVAAKIKEGMNKHLWQDDKGYYGQYLYGRNFKTLSPRAEALGEALSVLFDVADASRQQQIVENTPVTEWGIPCIYPQIPNIPPYHNNGVWPFVQAFWSLAAAKTGNEAALTESLAAIYRPAALFLTNKENFVASTGDFAGTQINSDRQLWSVAGNIGMVYKVFFGMDFQADQLRFAPFVPQAYKGRHQLSNFRYRNAVLDIELEGWGNSIRSITLDGKELPDATITGNLEGVHQIRIILADKVSGQSGINKQTHYVSPEVPKVTLAADGLSWRPVSGAVQYLVLKNGKRITQTTSNQSAVSKDVYGEYQVIAVDQQGVESFASEPVEVVPVNTRLVYELETVTGKAAQPYKGFSGEGFVEVSKNKNRQLPMSITIPEDGLYAIDFRYANGNGPINTENKAAIRTLKQGNEVIGTLVLPQRGTNEWSDWGFTNAVVVPLKKGTHTLSLTFEEPYNENMNGEVNEAMLDYLRLTKLK